MKRGRRAAKPAGHFHLAFTEKPARAPQDQQMTQHHTITTAQDARQMACDIHEMATLAGLDMPIAECATIAKRIASMPYAEARAALEQILQGKQMASPKRPRQTKAKGAAEMRAAATAMLRAGEATISEVANWAGVDRQLAYYWAKSAGIDVAVARASWIDAAGAKAISRVRRRA